MPAEAPPAEQQGPYIPPGPPPLVCEQFQGIDTSTTRPGVKDDKLAWCDGFMPVGPLDLRVLPDVGTILFTGSANTISFFEFVNIGATPYCIVISTDGSIRAINTITSVSTTIAPAGTITSPSSSNQGVSQYGNQYAIIVSSQTNGYFLWNGTLFFGPGTLSPVVTITNGGSGYVVGANVTFGGGSGIGTTGVVTTTNNIVTAITITNPGTGWLATDSPTITINGTHTIQATATVSLMPFGISGTAVETYSGHVWVANNDKIIFSAPGSVTVFATSAGGGNFASIDSFLRVGFSQLLSTNGFLYLIGDSSVNYISGVQTSGSPPTTTFSNQNADPEVGTPYGQTVDVFGRNILFANSFGAHVSYGAAVTKISDDLDGVYSTVANFGGLVPSAAKAIIFGKKVWILLIRIVDPVTGSTVNKMFMWNGKVWWSSSQSVTLTYIQHQEINSVITAWGTNGTSIYPLFQTPSTSFTKTIQTKMWAVGGYFLRKAAGRLWALFQNLGSTATAITINVDNENGITSNSVTVTPAISSAIQFVEKGVGQQGQLLGLTLTTTIDSAAVISLALQPEIVGYQG